MPSSLRLFAATGLSFVAILAPNSAQAIGLLVPAQADLDPLMIGYHRVHTVVRERMAETRVEQSFRNHTQQVLEATYIFPVPEGAVVSGFAMWVNGRRQPGELLERGQARRVYEDIVRRMEDPGLIEYMGGNLFRARVFPIPANAEQRIEIRFTQMLSYDGGVIHYRYPLRTGGDAARTLEDLTITTQIVSRTPIRAVYSPSHQIAVDRRNDHRVVVGYEAEGVALDEDFDLYYGVQDRDVGLSLLTHRTANDDGYFLAMIAPRTEVTEREIARKDIVFVFDTSGSMAGEKIDRAKAALHYMLARLRPTDHFQVVRFSTDVEQVFDGRSVPATPANVGLAQRAASRFVAAGGTAIDAALTTALETHRPRGRPSRMVVFLTDGMPTIGETNEGIIVGRTQQRIGDARLFAFGVGNNVNTTFLDRLAQENGGMGDYFRDGREMERRMSAFYDRIAYPLLTDLALSMPGLRSFDTYPRDLGHLYRGDQLFVVGRYRGDGPSRLALRGRVSNERSARRFSFPVTFPATEDRNAWLPRLWATRKIGFLLDEIRLRGNRSELREEVTQLAQRFGIVTPFTSYLVVEDQAIPEDLQRPPREQNPRDAGIDSLVDQALGGRRAPPPPTTQPEPADRFRGFDETTYDFEDDLVEGDLARPDGQILRFQSGASRRPLPAPSAPAPRGGTGEQGRRISAAVRELRQAERSEAAVDHRLRPAAGRTFRRVRSVWVDTSFRRSMPTLTLGYGTRSYFALLRRRPELRPAFALGREVVVVYEGKAIRVVRTAPDVSDEQLRRFVGG
ncbi:MAG: VIT domain-containing protein [Myxococcota bacterium]